MSRQLDAIEGCPELQVADGHLARAVRELVEALDTRLLEESYSSLGRRGFHPRRTLAVWIYGSLVGLHESTKLAAALETDAALRMLSGGHRISAGTLRRFRNLNRAFFESAIAQTVQLAHERGLLHQDQLGVDSVRLRAHASTKAVRTEVRSRKRLEKLLLAVTTDLSDAERATCEEKIAKHQHALARCEAEGRTNFVVTNPGAGLLKFPDGASAPGHRVTIVAAGVRERLILSVLIDADGHDHGKGGPALTKTKELFDSLGIRNEARMQAALDAGYWSEADLQFAADHRDWVDMLVAERSDEETNFFSRSKFVERDDGTIICPIGRQMRGPWSDGKGRAQRYTGVGCNSCALKPQCTTGRTRSLTIRRSFDEVRRLMRERMATPGAQERYGQRIATIEPVFSNLESTMKYRRVTTRHERGMTAEILLKVLAHNVSRLAAARRLLRAFLVVDAF